MGARKRRKETKKMYVQCNYGDFQARIIYFAKLHEQVREREKKRRIVELNSQENMNSSTSMNSIKNLRRPCWRRPMMMAMQKVLSLNITWEHAQGWRRFSVLCLSFSIKFRWIYLTYCAHLIFISSDKKIHLFKINLIYSEKWMRALESIFLGWKRRLSLKVVRCGMKTNEWVSVRDRKRQNGCVCVCMWRMQPERSEQHQNIEFNILPFE